MTVMPSYQLSKCQAAHDNNNEDARSDDGTFSVEQAVCVAAHLHSTIPMMTPQLPIITTHVLPLGKDF